MIIMPIIHYIYETKAKSSLIGRLARPWLPGSNRTQTHGLHCETLRRLYLCAHFRPVDSMPRYCSVYGCFNNSEKNRDVSYHDFPSNNEQAKAWKIRIRREGFEPSKYSYVCSKHFRPEDFTTPSKDTPLAFQKPRLKRRTIPSVLLRGETVDGKKSRTTNTAGRALEPLSLKSKVEKEEKPAAANFYTPMDFTFDSQDELDKKKSRIRGTEKGAESNIC